MINKNNRFDKVTRQKHFFVSQPEQIEHLTKQVVKGGGIALTGCITGNTATFGLHLLLGRTLGPGAYGLFVLGMTVIKIAQSIASLGLTQGIVRFCAVYRGEKDHARLKGTIISAILISLTSSVFIAVILFIFSDLISYRIFHEPNLTWILRIFSVFLPFYILIWITTAFAQSFKRIEYQQGVENIFRPLASFTLVGLALLMGFDFDGAVYGVVASWIFSAGFGFYFVWKIYPDIISRIKPIFASKNLLKFSVPLSLAGISYLALNQMDRIMLGIFSSSSEVGKYNAAFIISQPLSLFLFALVTIFSPIIADLFNKKQFTELSRLYKIVSRWIFTISFPFAVILCIFSKQILSLFGSAFTEAWPVLIILVFSQVALFSAGGAGAMMQMTGNQYLVLVNTSAMLAVNIGLNLWLIPQFGKLGAALATAISITVVQIALLIQVFKILRIHPFSVGQIKSLLAATLILIIGMMGLQATKELSLNLVLHTFFLLSIYGLSLWLLGLDYEDKKILRAFKKA